MWRPPDYGRTPAPSGRGGPGRPLTPVRLSSAPFTCRRPGRTASHTVTGSTGGLGGSRAVPFKSLQTLLHTLENYFFAFKILPLAPELF